MILIGHGELESEVKDKVSKLGIKDKVIFLGKRDDVYLFYNAMDLFLLPSRYEGLPVVGIEAQANGLPCIFSNYVTKEAKILDSTSFVKGGVVDYVDLVINKLNLDRKDIIDELKKSGFDIEVEAQKLLFFYKSLYNKC